MTRTRKTPTRSSRTRRTASSSRRSSGLAATPTWPHRRTRSQVQYEKDRATATRLPHTAKLGSMTDCGRMFILLGKPDEVQGESTSMIPGVRGAETWIYKDKPGRTFQGGQRRDLPSTSSARAGGHAHPAARPHRGLEGRPARHRLPLPEERPPGDARRPAAERHGGAPAVQAAAPGLQAGRPGGLPEGGSTGARRRRPGLRRRGRPGVAEAGGKKIVNVSVAASAVGEDGKEVGLDGADDERRRSAPTGRFVGSFKLGSSRASTR